MKHIIPRSIFESIENYNNLPIHGKDVAFLSAEELEMLRDLNIDDDNSNPNDKNIWLKNIDRVYTVLNQLRSNFYRSRKVYMTEAEFYVNEGVFKLAEGHGVKYQAWTEDDKKKPKRDISYDGNKRSYVTAHTREGTNNFLVKVQIDKKDLIKHIGKENITEKAKRSFSYGVNQATQSFSLYFISETPVMTVGELANLIHETCNTSVTLEGPIEDLNFKLGNLKLHSVYDGYTYKNHTLGKTIETDN